MAETPAGETRPPPSPAFSSNGPTSGAQVTAPNAATLPMFPVVMMYPTPLLPPGMAQLQNLEEQDQGPGIYAIPYNPYMGPATFPTFPPPNTLIPLTYKIPTAENSAAVVAGQAQGQDARQQNGAQRQIVVRRFHFAFQLDLTLIIKLAAIVFLFSQEGSKQRLVLLCFFALLVYLYQTGVLAPLIRWVHRAGAIRPPQPPARADNRPPVPQNNGNDQQQAGNVPNANANQNQAAGENQEAPPAANENRPEQGEGGNRGNWLGIVKEIQMFVVGFVASLLPGFQHND